MSTPHPAPDSNEDADVRPARGPTASAPPPTPRWVKAFGIIGIVLILLVVIVLVTGVGGPGSHGPGRHLSPTGEQVQQPGTGTTQ